MRTDVQTDQHRHRRGGDHHRRDGPVAAEFQRGFVAENAGGHGNDGEYEAHGDRRHPRRGTLVRHHVGPESHQPGPNAVELEAVRAVSVSIVDNREKT